MNGTAASLHRELLAVCSSVVGGSVSTADGIRTIRKQFLQKDERTISVLFDVITALSQTAASEQPKAKEFFAAVASQFLPEDVLKLEVPQMGSDSKEAKARVIKAKTKIYYKQLKFNLFREENEGYSKLVTELMSVEPIDDPAALFSRISKLIGTFNLDPNRAVDVILDCFSCNTTCHKVYIGLLKALNFEAEVVKKIVLLKFIMFKNAEHTSNSFYRVVVMLCAFGMLDILEIFAAVHPPQRELVERMEELKKVTAKRVSKASTISTVAAAAVDGRNAVNSGLDDGHPAASSSQSGPPARPFSSVVYAQDLDDRKECGEFFDESLNLSQNQKLGLLMGALEVGSWSIALKLLRLFPDGFPLALLRSVAVSLGDILEYVLEPFYLQKMTPAWPDRSLDPKSWDEKFFEKPDRMTKWEDLKTRVLPILHVLGPYLGYHREVGEKLIRILATFFEDEKAQAEANSQEMSNLIFRIVDFCLLPSVSLIEPSYTYVDELWTIVSRLPYDKRYMMYGRWKGVHSKECHGLLVQAGKVTGQMKYVMKRLNKENVSMCGRHLGKISLSHPTVAFDYLLERLQQFDNLIGPVVDSMKYLSDMAFDVLSYSLIESLADPLKQTLKTSDGTLSKWLQALASFSGAVYRRYNVEYEGLLQYIANQLKDKKSFDLMVLREVLTATTGFEPLQSLTGDQLDALCSGDQIRLEVIGRLNGHQKGRRQAISRLRDALLHTDLCEQLAFLLAQQKNCVVFIETKEAPAKLASQILDQCQETFLQYVSFVRSHVKDDEYRERIPTVEVLLKTCNLPPEAAFHLARSKYLCRAISTFDLSKKLERETSGVKKLDAEKKTELYKEAFGEELKSLVEELDKTKESGFWTDLSCHVYAIFWLFSISDIYVPTELYEKEIERVRREAAEAPKSSDHSKSRRTKDDDRSRAEQKLSSEFSRQKEHVKRSKEFLIHVKDQLFAQSTTSVVPQLMRFIYSCLLPRCIFSEVDAVYSARFIFLLHSVRTSWFPTLTLLDKLFHEITPLFSAFSENEATAFGKFLSLLLETTLRWHSKEEIFQEECNGFPGFLAVQSAANPYDSFRTICYKWQLGMKTLVLFALGEKSSYILLRNSFLILKKLINHFPLIKSHLPELETAVTAVRDREKEKRPDLSLMAQSYLVVLKKRSVRLWETDEFYNPASMNPKTPPSKDAAQEKKTPKEKESAKEKDSPKEKDASKPKESSKANGTSKSNGASRQNSTAGNGDAPPTSSSQSSPASASLSASRKRPTTDSPSADTPDAKHSRRERERVRS